MAVLAGWVYTGAASTGSEPPANDAVALATRDGGDHGSMFGLRLAQASLPVATVTPQEPGPGESPASPAPRGAARRWVVPPIVWSGRAQYDFRNERFEGGTASTRHYLTARIEAKTYLWQPWFARVDGALGFSIGRSTFRATTDSESEPRSDLTDGFLTGGAGIELFPVSRFPFTARLEATDSRVDGSGTGLEYRQVRLRLDQRFVPESRAWNLSASYEHATQSGSFIGRDNQDTVTANWQLSQAAHSVTVDGSASWNRRGETGESTLFDTLIGRHTWRPEPGLTLDSTASYAHNLYDLRFGRFENRIAQLSSIGFWYPQGKPWSLTASARATISDFGSGSASTGAALSLGGSYQFTRNWRGFANVATFANRAGGTSSSGIAGSSSVTYQSDPVQIASFDASLFGSLNGSYASGGALDAGQGAVQAGYTIARAWPIGTNFYLTINANQSVGYAATTTDRDSPIVATTLGAGANWTSDASQAFLRLSVNDARATAADGFSITLANLQFAGSLQFGRYRTLSGDISVQRTWQRLEPLPLTDEPAQNDPLRLLTPLRLGQTSASANLVYTDNRFVNVPRLRFVSEVRVTNDIVNDFNPLAPIYDRATRQWINRIEYTIGRLLLGAHVALYTLDGVRNETFMIRVQRDFGIY